MEAILVDLLDRDSHDIIEYNHVQKIQIERRKNFQAICERKKIPVEIYNSRWPLVSFIDPFNSL